MSSSNKANAEIKYSYSFAPESDTDSDERTTPPKPVISTSRRVSPPSVCTNSPATVAGFPLSSASIIQKKSNAVVYSFAPETDEDLPAEKTSKSSKKTHKKERPSMSTERRSMRTVVHDPCSSKAEDGIQERAFTSSRLPKPINHKVIVVEYDMAIRTVNELFIALQLMNGGKVPSIVLFMNPHDAVDALIEILRWAAPIKLINEDALRRWINGDRRVLVIAEPEIFLKNLLPLDRIQPDVVVNYGLPYDVKNEYIRRLWCSISKSDKKVGEVYTVLRAECLPTKSRALLEILEDLDLDIQPCLRKLAAVRIP
ncbi:hypothetical protein QR680_002850 [Steinernema hermaphroditum]|uniref:Uncharacterized protein n=1 Tax=Steinernema hermaphroditum TaxID=289476 RepID=A0AA39LJ30_9BILA|nr:hypothetical protein QR680_002850 [Steinernema hermaphroditum]